MMNVFRLLKTRIARMCQSKGKVLLALFIGFFVSASAAAYAATASDAWNIGNGWLFFKTASDAKVHANVEAPVDAQNVVNKGYVDAQGGGGGGGGAGEPVFYTWGVSNVNGPPGQNAPACPTGWIEAYKGYGPMVWNVSTGDAGSTIKSIEAQGNVLNPPGLCVNHVAQVGWGTSWQGGGSGAIYGTCRVCVR